MSRNPKMVICRNCNTAIAKNAKVCPSCGAKNKKPFYKKVWFVILVIIVAIGVISSNGDDSEEKTNEKNDVTIEQSQDNESASVDTNQDNVAADTNEENSTSNETTNNESSGLVDGMRPEFKEAMDSYEAFYDEYCDFMKKYKANPTDMTLLGEYTNMVSKLADMDAKFNAWDESTMNAAELKYYAEVNNRVAQKLLEVSQ